MPDAELDDGSRLFDHMRGPQATEIATPQGQSMLIRPDGYIAQIGEKRFIEYFGERTKTVGALFNAAPYR